MTTTTATPVRFTQRAERTLVLGLSATRAITLGACVFTVAIMLVTSGMTAGLITAIGISPAAGSALLTVEGRAMIEWTPVAAQHIWRAAGGQLRFLATPDRPRRAGTLPLPGTAGRLAVWQAADGTAILHDRAANTWTAIAAVTGGGFLYADAETQDGATAGFGRALAAIGSDGQIERIHIIHRTRPDGGEGLKAARTLDTGRSGSAAANDAYLEALAQHAAGWWRHDTLVAITMGGKAARAAIHRAGHGRTAAARILDAHRTSLPAILANADATVEAWFTPADLADWIRGSFDPASIPLREHHRQAAASTDGAGPMAVEETWSTLHTDSAFHQVLWISQWPRFETHPAFLAPVILPAGATVTVSMIFEPVPVHLALRQIGRDKTAQASDAALRRRFGTIDTAEHAAKQADTLQREVDLTEGHLDMRHATLIAITADSSGDLTDAVTRIRQAAAAAGCETRILYGQQLQAFTAATLPAGLRL